MLLPKPQFGVRAFLLVCLIAGAGTGLYLKWLNERTIRITAHEFVAHRQAVHAIAFSRRGHLLATAAEDIKLWNMDLPSNKPYRTIAGGHASQVESLTFTNDGKSLLAADRSGIVREWDVATGTERKCFAAARSKEQVMPALAPEGQLVSWLRPNGTYEVWDLPTEQKLRSGNLEWSFPESSSLSADGKTLSAAGGPFRVVDTVSNDVKTIRNAHYRATAFSRDCSMVAVSDEDVPILDLATGMRVANVLSGGRWVTSVAFSADDSVLAIGNSGGKVVIRELKRDLVSVQDPLLSFKSSTEVAEEDRLHELELAREAVIQSQAALKDGVYGEASDAATRALAVLPDDAVAKEVKAAADKRLLELGWHRGNIAATALSPDGTLLATGGDDQSVRLWSLSTDMFPTTLSGHLASLRSVAFADGGAALVSASQDGVIKKWEVSSGRQLDSIALESSQLRQIALSHNGKFAVLARVDPFRVEVWDPWRKARLWQASANEIGWQNGAVSPDGQRLAVAHGKVSFIDSSRKQWIDIGPTPDREYYGAVAFSGDGKLLAVSRGEIVLMDASTFAAVKEVAAQDGRVCCIALSADGRHIAVGMNDGRALVLNVADSAVLNKIGYPTVSQASEP
jgi:WD40 repeat protein